MAESISWIVQASVNDGKLDELKALIAEMVAATEEESGAQAYEWFLSPDGGTLHIYERYADGAAVEAHMKTWAQNFADRFADTLTPTSFTVYGAVDDQASAALKPLRPMYMDRLAGFTR